MSSRYLVIVAGMVAILAVLWLAPSVPRSQADELVSPDSPVTASGKVDADCRFKGTRLWGKVKVVDSFPDFKIRVVRSFADLHVKKVDSFPDKCGRWRFVDSFPDFTVKLVDSFPDFEIKYVDSFPGVP